MKRWLAIITLTFLSILIIYPSAFIYSKDTLPDTSDTRLIAYIIGQVQQNIIKHQPLYYGSFFAPDKNTLTYSDPFVTSSLLTMPFRAVTTHPIQIFNIAFVLGFILTIICSYLLFDYLFKDPWVTILSVIIFNFSGYHLHYYPHIQMLLLWPLLLAIYFFIRYQRENKLVYLYLFFIATTIQMAESLFPVYLIFFIIITIFLIQESTTSHSRPEIGHGSSVIRGESIQINTEFRTYLYRFRVKPGMTKEIIKLFLHSLPFLPVWAFLIFPYLELHNSLPEATRPIRDAAHFSLGLEEIFTKYHSWTTTILFLISSMAQTVVYLCDASQSQNAWSRVLRDFGARIEMIGFRRRSRIIGRQQINTVESRNNLNSKNWKILFLFSLVMSLGPVLKIFGKNLRIFTLPIPLPYSLFYYLFPGFTGFRTPSRFIILALLAAVIIIGYFTKPIFAKLKSRTKNIILALITTLIFIEADLPLKAYPVNINMHPVYQEVKNLPKDASIIELPIKLWNMPNPETELTRALYSLEHGHRRLGGISGFATNNWIEIVEKINYYGLNEENVATLKSLSITHIVENNKLRPLP